MAAAREARIPEAVIRSMRGASGAERAVLEALYLHADASGRCYPGYAAIADVTGLNRRTIQRAIEGLEDRIGLTRSRPEHDTTTPYRYQLPGGQMTATPTEDRRSNDRHPGGLGDTTPGGQMTARTAHAEQHSNSSASEHVANAASALALWHGRPVDVDKLAALADGALPSELGRAVDKLTARAAASVTAPLSLLALILQDERSNRVPV